MRNNKSNDKGERNNRRRIKSQNRKPDKNQGYSKELEESRDSKYSNDPKWYATDEALLRDAASYPFSWATGPVINHSPVDLSHWNSSPVQAGQITLNNSTAGGLASFYLLPSVGCSVDKDSPINIASFSLFSFVRHANSGNSNYDAVDLMQYVLAMSSVYSYINFCQRLYGLAFTFSQRNSYIPDVFFASVGIDYNDIRSNLANFRLGLNILINQAASFAVPNTIPLLVRQSFVYTGLYSEGTSIKDQMYMYNPAGFWCFTYDSDQAGLCKLLPFYCKVAADAKDVSKYYSVGSIHWRDNAALRGYQFLLDYGTFLMKNLVNNQDFKIMSGDITKAFGQNTIKLASIPEVYQVLPEFNIGVLEQMCNATVIDADSVTGLGYNDGDGNYHGVQAFSIYQGGSHAYLTNAQYYNLSGTTTLDGLAVNHICVLGEGKTLTTTTDQTDPGLVMESSRLMLSCTPLLGVDLDTGAGFVNDANVLALNSGSEVCTDAIYFFTQSQESAASDSVVKYGYANVKNSYDAIHVGTPNTSLYYDDMGHNNMLRSFRFRNPQHIVVVSSTYKLTHDLGVNRALDNFTVLAPADIANLHRAAIINQVNVPYVHRI